MTTHSYCQAKRGELERGMEGSICGGGSGSTSAGAGAGSDCAASQQHFALADTGGRDVGTRWREEKAAVSATAAQTAQLVRQQQAEQEQRLRDERAKKKVLWEEELQRELEYQKQQQAAGSSRQ